MRGLRLLLARSRLVFHRCSRSLSLAFAPSPRPLPFLGSTFLPFSTLIRIASYHSQQSLSSQPERPQVPPRRPPRRHGERPELALDEPDPTARGGGHVDAEQGESGAWTGFICLFSVLSPIDFCFGSGRSASSSFVGRALDAQFTTGASTAGSVVSHPHISVPCMTLRLPVFAFIQ